MRLRARQTRIARLDRLAAPAAQHLHGAVRQTHAIALYQRQGIGAGRRVGHGWPGGNVHRVVAGHIRNQQGDHLCRVTRGSQAPTLDRREVAADDVHLADGRARFQEFAVDGLFVGQRNALERQTKQRGTAARDQADDGVVGGQAAHGIEDASRSPQPCFVGHRMRGLENFNALARHRVAVAGHHHAGKRTGPRILEGARHGRRSLAGADDDQPSFRRLGQEPDEAMRRLRGFDGGIKHRAQQVARRHGGSHVRSSPTIRLSAC